MVAAPVNLTVFQIVQVYLANGGLLVAQRILCVFAPEVGGTNDDTVSKGLFARCGEEAVYVAFLQAIVFGIELALDGVVFAGVGLGDKVYAGVAFIQSLLFRPIAVRPYVAIKVAVGSFVSKVTKDQFLEVGAFFALGGGGLAKRFKQAPY